MTKGEAIKRWKIEFILTDYGPYDDYLSQEDIVDQVQTFKPNGVTITNISVKKAEKEVIKKAPGSKGPTKEGASRSTKAKHK